MKKAPPIGSDMAGRTGGLVSRKPRKLYQRPVPLL